MAVEAPPITQRVVSEGVSEGLRPVLQVLAARLTKFGSDSGAYDSARETQLFDLRPHIKGRGDRRYVGEFFAKFPFEERPLVMTTFLASTLDTRYDLSPTVYGQDAIDKLSNIALGDNQGNLPKERTPMGDIVDILVDTFGDEAARDVLVDAVHARKDHIKGTRRSSKVRGVTPQDVEALQDGVELLPLFTGESVADAIVDTITFAYVPNDVYAPVRDRLFSRSVEALAAFSGNQDHDNVALLLKHRKALESLQAQLVLSGSHKAEIEVIEPLVKLLLLRDAHARVHAHTSTQSGMPDEVTLQSVIDGLRAL